MLSDEYEDLCENLLKQKIDITTPIGNMLEPYMDDCRVLISEKKTKERAASDFEFTDAERRAMRINVKRVTYETWVQVLSYIASGFALGISLIIVSYIEALISLWLGIDPNYPFGNFIALIVKIIFFLLILSLVVYIIYRISKKSGNVSKAETLSRLFLAYELEQRRLPVSKPIVKLRDDPFSK